MHYDCVCTAIGKNLSRAMKVEEMRIAKSNTRKIKERDNE